MTASIGVHFDKPYLKNVPGYKEGINRPNALILCYPVITSGEFAHKGSFKNLLGENAPAELLAEMSLENHVSENTPPSFIWHTFEDRGVPVENSMLFASKLREKNIPFELHIFPEGGHGLSLATKEVCPETYPHVAKWIDLCIEWLDSLFA